MSRLLSQEQVDAVCEYLATFRPEVVADMIRRDLGPEPEPEPEPKPEKPTFKDTMTADELVKLPLKGAMARLRDGRVVTLDCVSQTMPVCYTIRGTDGWGHLDRRETTAHSDDDILRITFPTGESYKCEAGVYTRVREPEPPPVAVGDVVECIKDCPDYEADFGGWNSAAYLQEHFRVVRRGGGK